MQITNRDVEILKFINDFGFCEMPHIEKRFNLNSSRGYQIMKRLTKGGFVKHERIFHGTHGAFSLTKAGAEFTDLSGIKDIPK